jgi:hypothetical protein
MPDFDSQTPVPGNLSRRPTRPMPTPLELVIGLSRLPRVEDVPGPGLIRLTVGTARGATRPAQIGALTDAALRGRLAHFDQHSANEIAAVRQALSKDEGRITVHETWSGARSCLQFWQGFTGSRIQPFTWLCVKCGNNVEEKVGGTVGEQFALRCKCGQVQQITVPK